MERDKEINKYNIQIVRESKKQSYPLSIVLPVFNVEKYLDRCIKSILEGDFKDLEIIIVNDGTKDNSEEKVIKLQKDKLKLTIDI